jgi:uncharacterized membrane protein
MTYLARKSIPTDLYESGVIQVLITLLSLAVVSIGTSIWAIVDATSKPPEAFVAIGSSKSTWIALIAVFTLFLPRRIHLGAHLPLLSATKDQ